MVDLKINVPKRLYEEMQKHKQINWNNIAKKGLEEKIKELELEEEIKSNK